MIKSPIKTSKSFLNIHTFNNLELVKAAINDVDTKLIVRPKIIIYGKEAHQNRNIGFFSNTSIGYFYSGQLAKSIPLTPNLILLLDNINSMFKSNFNGILVNKYIDGNNNIGAHSDDEKNLDPIGVVALSYGAIRKFRIRDKITRKILIDIPTESNEIIHMGGDFQKEFTHEIPIEKKVKTTRYSFTFRKHSV
jgi:alkylated DNA repair dioxygenase AlkB